MLHAYGFKSGVYGSPCNAADWAAISNVPDVVWLADWNNDPDVWGLACLPDGLWKYDQRLHQYAGNVWEYYGGYWLQIDRDCAKGLVTPNGHTGENTACTVE